MSTNTADETQNQDWTELTAEQLLERADTPNASRIQSHLEGRIDRPGGTAWLSALTDTNGRLALSVWPTAPYLGRWYVLCRGDGEWNEYGEWTKVNDTGDHWQTTTCADRHVLEMLVGAKELEVVALGDLPEGVEEIATRYEERYNDW